VTMVVTSCNRHDLLLRTLRSFCEHNTYPLTETIIIEDGPTPQPELNELTGLGKLTWINNGRRIGQIKSIDKAYRTVTTPWIFHTEDDWEFLRPGFIEDSMEILKKHPSIWTVSLRANDCNGHPNGYEPEFPGIWMQEKNWGNGWGSMNFNAGLRRLSDYERIEKNYYKIAGDAPAPKPEWYLSITHRDMGYRIAVLPELTAIHLGEGRSRALEAVK
jgi:GT2 family glycosyltransferase